MEFFSTIFDQNFSFIRNTIVLSIISSIPIGIVGTFVVVNRMSYIAGAISHSVLGGIGIAIYLSTVFETSLITPSLGGLIFATLSGLIISLFYLWGRERVDTAISAVWIIGMSIGIIFAYFTPRYTDLSSYLFGNILLVSVEDVWYVVLISLVVLTVVSLFFHQLVLVSFDKDFSITRGINPKLLLTILILLISLTVFLMVKIVGTILAIALITLPSAISNMFSKRISAIILSSILIAMLSQLLGLFISFELDIPTGVTITILLGAGYILTLLSRGLVKLRNY
ncbi:MAG: metal ABC transporter permease [Spirochaetia bacterium]|nr:metal ABC transporter permease [Spirochaetota bacterium]MCX8096061.1 metal ABC transporter permease [Spirochaetota bacterium]MDW8113233.1 metal ABC transporter permease [Spirochaetia bacterium]